MQRPKGFARLHDVFGRLMGRRQLRKADQDHGRKRPRGLAVSNHGVVQRGLLGSSGGGSPNAGAPAGGNGTGSGGMGAGSAGIAAGSGGIAGAFGPVVVGAMGAELSRISQPPPRARYTATSA